MRWAAPVTSAQPREVTASLIEAAVLEVVESAERGDEKQDDDDGVDTHALVLSTRSGPGFSDVDARRQDRRLPGRPVSATKWRR